jgi:tRNA 5-methylaminomethyl-2-thiouridine biosynthesis bifunctional protein
VIAEGVLQLEQAPRDATRFDKIAAQDLWPVDAMTRLDAAAVSEHLDETVSAGGLRMAGALALRPAAVLEPWLAGAERLTARVAGLQPDGEGWRLVDADGATLVRADAVVLTSGWGSAALAPELPLAPVAGQADWVEGPTTRAVAWGGYAVPTGNGLLFGATHDRGQTDLQPTAEASSRNLAALTAALPDLAAQVGAAGAIHTRKAVRATTPDRLPVAGALGPRGLYVLTGLGSRGFCVAPLLGEDLAAQVLNHPSPLPRDARQRLSPARFKRA